MRPSADAVAAAAFPVPVEASQITERDVSTPGLAERREEVGVAESGAIASGDPGLQSPPLDSFGFAVFLWGVNSAAGCATDMPGALVPVP